MAYELIVLLATVSHKLFNKFYDCGIGQTCLSVFPGKARTTVGDSRSLQEGNKEVQGGTRSPPNMCYQSASPSGNQCRHAAMCFFSTKRVMVFRHIHKFPIGRANTSGWDASERQQEECVKEPSRGYKQRALTPLLQRPLQRCSEQG